MIHSSRIPERHPFTNNSRKFSSLRNLICEDRPISLSILLNNLIAYFYEDLNCTWIRSILYMLLSFPIMLFIISFSMKFSYLSGSFEYYYKRAECHDTYLSLRLERSMIFLNRESAAVFENL